MGTATAPIFAKAKVADTYSGELYSWMATLSPFFSPRPTAGSSRAVHQAVEFAVGERAAVAGPILAGQKR